MRKLSVCVFALALFGVCTACDRGDSSEKTKNNQTKKTSENTGEEKEAKEETNDDEASGNLVSTQLAKVRKSIGCPSEDSPYRLWCIATEGWNDGEPAKLPKGEKALLGLTLEVEKDVDVAKALQGRVHLSGLAIRNSGDTTMAKITSVEPENEKEKDMVAKSIFNLGKLYKGGDPPATIPKKLMGFVESLPKQAEYEVKKADQGWTWEGKSDAELRKVDDYWVAIEIPEERNGIFLNIFTDQIEPGDGE